MAQLFEKVDLRGEEELLKIQVLLDDALNRRLQATGAELTKEELQELQGTSAEFVAQLRQFVVFAEDHQGCGMGSAAVTQRTQLTPAAASLALRSPLLRPLSPPPVDAEVQELEAEVTAASLRVAKLRTSMQARLQDTLAAKLAACRPTAELEPEPAGGQAGAPAAGAEQALHEQQLPAEAAPAGEQLQHTTEGEGVQPAQEQTEAAKQPTEGEQRVEPMDSDDAEVSAAAGKGAEEAAPIPMSPQPRELQQRLLQAANRMPELRARLEQAADKLQRVVTAVAADINRPPPNTVERAVLGKTPGRPVAPPAAEKAAGVSPLFKQALESGQINTRRRVAQDVQPVPYNSQQD